MATFLSEAAPLFRFGHSQKKAENLNHPKPEKSFSNAAKSHKATWSGCLPDVFLTLAGLAGTAYLAVTKVLPLCLTVLIYSLFVLKSFLIFHDAGHNSYTPSKTVNRVLSEIFGVITLTQSTWSVRHRIHHSVNGKMDQEIYPWSETVQYTVDDYEKLPSGFKYFYRIVRDPKVFFVLAPLFVWGVKERLVPTANKVKPYLINNAGVAVFLWGGYQLGISNVQLSGSLLAGIYGVLLFHNQHVFNPAYVLKSDKWTFHDSAFIGSSFIIIPGFLKWFTHGIEYHHIHHYLPTIPGYNLRRFHNENEAKWQGKTTEISLWDALFVNTTYTLFDEKLGKFVTF
jgi:omega-6 fatty acid desaturase (delta-12 desaturase)